MKSILLIIAVVALLFIALIVISKIIANGEKSKIRTSGEDEIFITTYKGDKKKSTLLKRRKGESETERVERFFDSDSFKGCDDFVVSDNV